MSTDRRSALPLEWQGIHKQGSLTSDLQRCYKSIPADYWESETLLLCCEATSWLTCILPLCCVTDIHHALTDEGLQLSLVSSLRSFMSFTFTTRLVTSLRHESPQSDWGKENSNYSSSSTKTPNNLHDQNLTKILYLVHSKTRNMVAKIDQLNSMYKWIWFKALWSHGGLFIRHKHFGASFDSVGDLCYLHGFIFNCAHSCGTKYLSQIPDNQGTLSYWHWSVSEWPLNVLCYCCLFLQTASFVSCQYFACCHKQWMNLLGCAVNYTSKMKEGSWKTAAPDLISSLPLCW